MSLWNRLQRQEAIVHAPQLWSYEVTSILHKHTFDKTLTVAEVEAALDVIFDLRVTLVEEHKSLCLAAFRCANRLKQRAAYDGFYVALAESLNADFWTADQGLCNNARDLGVNWVHFIAEA